MAGIGFELRKILRKETLASTARAYAYAGLISSGPLILSIFGILIIGLVSLATVIPTYAIVQFQVSVTYLIALSLILTGPLQLSFTRFISDRLFEKRDDLVLPNYNAMVLVSTIAASVVAVIALLIGFTHEPLLYRVLMMIGFVVISNIWIAVIFLSSVKQYRQILLVFFVGYATVVGLAIGWNHYGLVGLLAGFVVGHVVLLAGLNALIYRDYHGNRFLSFEVFDRRFTYPTLAWVGLLFNVGVWIDKFMFWYAPATSANVIGPLRASVIYDIPIFIAYVCVMPGMAAFLVRIEADFVEYYDAFYDAVRNGATLGHIQDMRNMMVTSVRAGLYEIMKVQIAVLLLLSAFGIPLFHLLGISPLYMPLLIVDVVSASLQILLLGVLNVFFYLDRRRTVLWLTGLFAVLNAIFTGITLMIGPESFGYGFAAALLCVVVIAIMVLDKQFNTLEYDTYMVRR